MAEPNEKQDLEHPNGSTMLKILDEKDKMILNLKESSTKRDKLNESQIRMLSEDLHQKTDLVKELRDQVKNVEYEALKKESELSIYKITNDKINDRLNALKNEITAYKEGLAKELADLKELINQELGQKDSLAKAITAEMRATITTLESKVKEVEEYYLGILKNISGKQGAAKKLVREAIDTLQDSLNYLDMGDLELYKPKHIEQEFQKVMETSRKAINEKEDIIRAGKSGDTIIRNIENVNVRLMQSPQLESIFSDLGGLSASAHKEVQALQSRYGGGSGGGGGAQMGISGAKAYGTPRTGARESKGTSGANGSGDGNTNGSGSRSSVDGGSDSNDGGQADEGGPMGAGAGGSQGGGFFGNQGPTQVFMGKENFAPFDWMKILDDMQLRKYSDLIKVCNKAIKEGNYVKAIKLFRSIREQPGIQEAEITTKMIDEEIEFLEKTVKDKYTRRED